MPDDAILPPNTLITQENVGPWRIWCEPPPIPVRDFDWHYQHEDTDLDCPSWMNGSCASREACIAEIIEGYEDRAEPQIRPALSPPAEGSFVPTDSATQVQMAAIIAHRDGRDFCDVMAETRATKATPTPAPADHIGDATEKVDWTVVGPKLVEAASWAEKALERYVDALGLDQTDDAALIALYKTTEALAAAQPEGK